MEDQDYPFPDEPQHLPHEAWHVEQPQHLPHEAWHIAQEGQEQHLPHEAWHVVQQQRRADGSETWIMRQNEANAEGNDIHVGPGQEQHLPHEAWHVVQEGGRRRVINRTEHDPNA